MPKLFFVHLLLIFYHVGESEIEVFAISIDRLVRYTKVFDLSFGVQDGCYKLLTLLFGLDIFENLVEPVVLILSRVDCLIVVTGDTLLHEGSPEHHDVLAFIVLIYLDLPVVLILQVLHEFDVLVSEISCAVPHL